MGPLLEWFQVEAFPDTKKMSIAILNDPQLSNDVYDLLISRTTFSLVLTARAELDEVALGRVTGSESHFAEPMSTSQSLALLLRL
ncbi:unnamed protein product [Haemonchus placei]|uniref:Response regulatory domain-containing protein n=1 Tax=Haemonchus placei TaxID=6290 RepID=A0A0N4WT96_HAEPC|nr:unnamed protein product [Haemonchus placei]